MIRFSHRSESRGPGRVVALVATLLVSLGAAAPSADAPRPHIVMILADDLGWADVGWHGPDIKTPNLDALASGGAKLEHFYVQPLCSPTRAALMTGRYPMRHGLQVGVVRPWASHGLPLDERTLPSALKQAGYETAICGKWHLGHSRVEYLPTRRGFDHQYGHYNGAIDYFTHERDGGFDWHRDDKVNRDEGYSTDLLANEAAKLVETHDVSRPLFLYLPFNAVHSPHQVPPRYKEPYAALPEPRRTYAGMTAAMDEAIGRVVAALDKKGIRENTLILFSSDNGGPDAGRVSSNGPLHGEKGTLYDGGVRVPAFANWPGKIKPNTVVDNALHMVDIYPTLLKLAGAPAEQTLPIDGRDAWPAISGEKAADRGPILINATPDNGAILADGWKLIVRKNGAAPADDEEAPAAKKKAQAKKAAPPAPPATELFHVAADPNETKNLADSEPAKVAELRKLYEGFASQAIPPRNLRAALPGFKVPKVWGEFD
ncbi:arylsulfatase B [Tundrisphaera sp. TA3]|uniref:arylsulfatase B n=1 Tax=Tundrisphaera sp. TA3 TaxID=3435775 RepID=UPI003EBEC63C